MIGTLNTPVLSLTPDSLASLGDLDGDSLSELWGVFTKCKDSLQNGRRLENLSWRLWFDSGRRESQSLSEYEAAKNRGRRSVADVPPSPAASIASVDTQGWSDPEWTEAETSEDSEAETAVESATTMRPGRPRRDSSNETTTTLGNASFGSTRRGSSLAGQATSSTPIDSSAAGAKARSNSVHSPARPSQQQQQSTGLTANVRGSSREWRVSSTISGGSIQRIVAGFNSLPPIAAPSKARSIANVNLESEARLSAGADGRTSRHSSAPEPLEVGILANNSLALQSTSPLASPSNVDPRSSSPRQQIDAPTQTTPSSSHRPSPSSSSAALASQIQRQRSNSSVRPYVAAPIPPTPSPRQSPTSATVVTSPLAKVSSAGSRGMTRSHSGQSNSSSKSTSSRMVKVLPPSSSSSPSQAPASAAPALPRHLSSGGSSAGRRSSMSKLNTAPTPASTPAPSLVVANHITRTPSAISHHGGSSTSISTLPSTSIAKSSTRGFDTRVEDARPRNGSIAPPPTPAAAAKVALADSPPKSAMKSPGKQARLSANTSSTRADAAPIKANGPSKKQMFFISSPGSDSEDEGTHSGRSRRYSSGTERRLNSPAPRNTPRSVTSPINTKGKGRATVQAPVVKNDDEDDEWDDDDDDDEEGLSEDESSSGWGSEYSTESDEELSKREQTQKQNKALFQKRPSVVLNGDAPLKPRPPGLLSQLFHPDLLDSGDRAHSAIDVARTRSNLSMTAGAQKNLTTSKSHGMLSAQRSKSFLKGAPEGVELESSTDEGETDSEAEPVRRANSQNQMAIALARHNSRQAEASIAPPQTPRTTRRAMLATELSESLRRNLLWERQTRNRALGAGATTRAPTMPPTTSTTPSTSHATANAPTASTSVRNNTAANALRPEDARNQQEHGAAAHPTTSTMVRRHTTGTGLYLAAQQDKLDRSREVPRQGRRRRRSGDLVDGDDTSTSVSSDEEGDSGTIEDEYNSIWGQRVW